MAHPEPPPSSRLETVLAAVIGSVIAVSIVAFFATMIGTWSGMSREDFLVGLWPTVAFVPMFGLPLGFVLIIVLLVVSTRRRRSSGGHGTAE
jgi:hypothetical protein